MNEKKYIGGSCKAVTTKFGEMMNLSLKLSDLQSIVDEKWYCNMTVSKRKEVWQFWDTHSVIENTWKPTPRPTTNSYDNNDFGQGFPN